MSNEPNPSLNNYIPETIVNNKEYFGVHSCASCRYVNYNGIVCGSLISPKSGQKITQDDWCRYWGPKMQNAPFYR